MMTTPKIRLLLADDHPMLLEGLASSLSRQTEFEIIGQARNGVEALEKARELLPDVFLLDIKMPGRTGFEITEILAREKSRIKILILSVYDESEYVLRLLRSGACGYLLKSAAPEEVVRAVFEVHKGGSYCSPELSGFVLKDFAGRTGDARRAEPRLTEREIQVMKMIALGDSTKEIAVKLGLTIKAVTSLRDRLMEKLNLHNAAAITRYAISQGYISSS